MSDVMRIGLQSFEFSVDASASCSGLHLHKTESNTNVENLPNV